MIKYKTSNYGEERIIKTECERETATTVYVKETSAFGSVRLDRRSKRSSWANYFDTFDEAKEFLIAKAQERVDFYKDQLQRAKSDLEVVQSLKEKVKAA